MRRWFTPQLIGLHLLTIVVIVGCVLLGFWQLGVYQNHQDQSRRTKAGVSAVPLSSVWKPSEVFTSDQLNRKVTVTGRFEPARQQFWVTDKTGTDGKQKTNGVWLVAPVTVDGRALLVVRGWAERAGELPAVPTGTATFTAVLQASEDPQGSGFDTTNRTIGSLQVPALINVLPYQLWSGYAISTTKAVSGGLSPATVPSQSASWSAGARNLGYGLQWWVFVGFAIFMWWRMCHDAFAKAEEKRSATQGPGGSPKASGPTVSTSG